MISEADQVVIDEMITRERTMKERQKIIEDMTHKRRVFKRRLVIACAAVVTPFLTILYNVFMQYEHWPMMGIVKINILVAILIFLLSLALFQKLIKYRPLKYIVQRYRRRIVKRYTEALSVSNRWLQFYYYQREISHIIPQILYYLEANPALETIDDAIAYIDSQPVSSELYQNNLSEFRKYVKQFNTMVLSTANNLGQPSSRQINFVTLDGIPNVWYFGTDPEASKVSELDLGRTAIFTLPTSEELRITSNRLKVYRTQYRFSDIAEAYQKQVPGYVESLSKEEQEKEIIFAIELKSARIDSRFQNKGLTFSE
ncbi:pyridoxamine 5'-phosphate oxidase family protein [Latilactobacillus curvatus]|uniref:pyridoxamine 5'-phosphate oxidase family protein n=3 Tax=Bacillati TaxID=1783272 RepID=UPI0021A4E7C9|nr:pyridoxamine 5'-phosphate oxidase family protein [Latilactobacillus curvatus]MCT3527883.1 pyridoxamine 5'-phosphate oxidase family protein [Latilactobacillus curvatus]MDG2987154.1 pyridoxamine 5'-phosphate oxidase family protein [Latilactobacillus curvatus]